MTNPTPDALCERLRSRKRIPSGDPELGPLTGGLVNPDGPEAADLIQQQQATIERLSVALEPFANCVEQIAEDEDDEEWAKFRLLIKDYRRAATVLWPKRKGFVRCPTCKGEFDEGEWNDSNACPECEAPKTSAALGKDASDVRAREEDRG